MNKQDSYPESYSDLPRQLNGVEKFLGDQQQDGFTIYKNYLTGLGKHLRLYYRRFTPQKAKASLCIVHGFGEHSGRFCKVAEYYCRQGYEVHLLDLRGFGYSGGARGTAVVEQLLMDVGVLITQVNASLPLFLYGHSMGGLLVLTFSILNPQVNVAGVITTSPLIGQPADRNLTWMKLKILFTVSKDLEDLVMNSMVNPTALTKNNAFLETSFGDRLLIPFLGIHMGASLLQATQQIKKHTHLFMRPLLIVHGKQDSVTNYQDSILFYDKCSAPEKSLKLFENGYHELQHDEEADELKSVVSDWIARRLQQNSDMLGNLPPLIYAYPVRKGMPLAVKVTIVLFVLLLLARRGKQHLGLKNILASLRILIKLITGGSKK